MASVTIGNLSQYSGNCKVSFHLLIFIVPSKFVTNLILTYFIAIPPQFSGILVKLRVLGPEESIIQVGLESKPFL